MRRKCKRDGNEKEIVEALRKAGATVEFLDLANGPDLLVGYHRKNLLFEIKLPKKELRDGQLDWALRWHGQIATIRSIEDALFWIEHERKGATLA